MANGLPRESIGHYTGLGQRILVDLNPNILVLYAIRMVQVTPTLILYVQCPPSIIPLCQDGKVWSGGGVTSGLDVSLAYLAATQGRGVAGQIQLRSDSGQGGGVACIYTGVVVVVGLYFSFLI